MNLLLTGATGFLGNELIQAMRSKNGLNVTAATRAYSELAVPQVVINGGFHLDADWASALEGQHVVVHAAARAHITNERSVDPLSEFRLVNVDGTLALARQAAERGVERFVFISSIGVNGNFNARPFTANDEPHPVEPYAISKWEAEKGLWDIQQQTGMEVVIIRPPLVYGARAPGNFASLVKWVDQGVPLPLGAIRNKRSFIGVHNLVDLIIHCTDHPAAANQVFLAGDGEDLSTTEMLRQVARAMDKPSRLIPVPMVLLQFFATLLGRKAMAQRLLGSLQVDIVKTRDLLNWKPLYTVEEGLKRCFIQSDR